MLYRVTMVPPDAENKTTAIDPSWLGAIQQTLLIPLWARAKWTEIDPGFEDRHAV